MALSFGDVASKIGQSLDIARSLIDVRNGLKAPKVAAAQGRTSTAPNQLAPMQLFIPGISGAGVAVGSGTPAGGLLQQVQNISPFGLGAIAAGIGGFLLLVFLLVRR